MGGGRVPTGAKCTNNVPTHEATCSLDDTIYQIAYAKMALACGKYHMRKWQSECDATGHFYCTARDKTFTATNYEDNGQKIEMGEKKKPIKAIKSNGKVG